MNNSNNCALKFSVHQFKTQPFQGVKRCCEHLTQKPTFVIGPVD